MGHDLARHIHGVTCVLGKLDGIDDLLALHGGHGQVVVAPPRIYGCDDGDDAGDRRAHLVRCERQLADARDGQTGLDDAEQLDEQQHDGFRALRGQAGDIGVGGLVVGHAFGVCHWCSFLLVVVVSSAPEVVDLVAQFDEVLLGSGDATIDGRELAVHVVTQTVYRAAQ